MSVVTVDPERLERYRETVGAAELAMIAVAGELRETLQGHARTNPDFGADHSGFAEEIADLARAGMMLSSRKGAIAQAARSADLLQLYGSVYVASLRLERALERAGLQAAWGDDGLHDIRRVLHDTSDRDWWLRVNGGLECPSGWQGRYGGGGAIVGPDGLLYPLVVPEHHTPGSPGEAVHLRINRGPGNDPRTLGGSDPG